MEYQNVYDDTYDAALISGALLTPTPFLGLEQEEYADNIATAAVDTLTLTTEPQNAESPGSDGTASSKVVIKA